MRVNLPDNISGAVETYYSKIELSTKDIENMFACSRSTAQKLKDMARKLMREEERMPFNKANVLTDVAFRAWSIDIDDLEKRLKKLTKFFGG